MQIENEPEMRSKTKPTQARRQRAKTAAPVRITPRPVERMQVRCLDCDTDEPMKLDQIIVFHGDRRGTFQTEYDANGRVTTFCGNGTDRFMRMRFACWCCWSSRDFNVVGNDDETFLDWS